MRRSTAFLLLGLGGALALFAYSRTRRGELAAIDTLEEVTVSAQRIGGDVLEGLAVSAERVTAAVRSVFTPRGIRNNNPGNIEWIANAASRWRGMIDSDGRFGIFDSAANGVRAIGGELKASIRKGQTIRQAIYEWAPPHENDTGAYVNVVARGAGAAPDDRLTVAMLPAVALAIIKHENGQQPYDPALVAAWVNS